MLGANVTGTLYKDETDPISMIKRMLGAVEKQIAAIERKMEREGVEAGEDDKMLGGLSRTMDILLGLLRKAESSTGDDRPDRDALRAELNRRLRGLMANGGGEAAEAGAR